MNVQDALVHLDDAIEALAIEMYKTPGICMDDERPEMIRVPAIQATIAVELERVDCAIGRAGESMFGKLAERIKQAMIAVHAAKEALQDA